MRALGKSQESLMRTLQSKGSWYPGCGWVWDTTGGTIKVLESLVKRDLVQKHRLKKSLRGEAEIYTLTETGKAWTGR